MPTSRADVRVQCPFYLYDECDNKLKKYRITCEGLVEHSTLALSYRHKKDFRIQRGVFCCDWYERCEVYRMLMQKYEEDDI